MASRVAGKGLKPAGKALKLAGKVNGTRQTLGYWPGRTSQTMPSKGNETMNAFKKLDKQNSIANLHTYKKFTDKAPVLHEPSARRSIKLLWKHITGKRWGPGEMTFGPNNNTTFKQHEVHFDLNGGWKLLIWAMASQFHKPSYYLEGKAGVLSKYANDKNYFKRKLKRIKRRKKKSKRNTREQEARSLTYMNERLVQLNHNIDGG